MNTTRAGDFLEEKIFDLLSSEITNGNFWAKRDCCKIFRKKAYYSRDRGADIIFDVVIEVYLPGAKLPSILTLVECKHYNHAVPVDDIEEFYSKIQQVTGANVKGVLASTNSFQKGAFNFAKSKGIALLRYFDAENFDWQLHRSSSASGFSAGSQDVLEIETALSTETYKSRCFDLFFQTPHRLTNSLWEVFDDFAVDHLNFSEVYQITNQRSRSTSKVEYVDRDSIESLTETIIANTGYVDGEVSLEVICAHEKSATGLKVIHADYRPADISESVLAVATFAPFQITLFKSASPHVGRERFTLAHELGHLFLRHNRYMKSERCEDGDSLIDRQARILSEDIKRMEWQANYFASSLLMPKKAISFDLWVVLREQGIHNKGYGALYLDDQEVNLRGYIAVTDRLSAKYCVSRAALTYRLKRLGFINDVRMRSIR